MDKEKLLDIAEENLLSAYCLAKFKLGLVMEEIERKLYYYANSGRLPCATGSEDLKKIMEILLSKNI